MSITDELREYVRHYSVAGSRKDETLTAIANRIDAEHEKSVVDALLNDGLPMSDEVMAEHGWVRLPKDADGVPIEGGLMESVDKLRMQVKALNGHRMSDASEEKLLAIADAIEREHGKLKHEAVCKAHADGERSGLKQARSASVDYNKGYYAAMDKITDGYAAYPTDVDGLPIHLGDIVYESKYAPNGGTVFGMKLYLDCDHWLINCGAWVDPRNCSHEKPDIPDTWERIIEDAYQGGHNDPDNEAMRKRLIERCKKLSSEVNDE